MTDMSHVRNHAVRATIAQVKLMETNSATWPGDTLRSQVLAAISAPDFVAVVLFCTIGLLGTLDLMLAVPGAALM